MARQREADGASGGAGEGEAGEGGARETVSVFVRGSMGGGGDLVSGGLSDVGGHRRREEGLWGGWRAWVGELTGRW